MIITGSLFAVWNGYFWIVGTTSGQEAIGENDIVASAADENSERETNDAHPIPDDESDQATDSLEEEIITSPEKEPEKIENRRRVIMQNMKKVLK
ncbi:hypothetical protein BB776_04490 [Planococcus salinarum]|uniref:Uncharacterized protein n=1 Tax=Planococcus salinarum TaxID=622695 RepID=A0ABX3CU84_9BACL|nr:hypothetical protein [Planococcus salinarum]OHX49047.1 hypothetical protein BB776_04490 [Planococcus salinarum]